MPNIRLNEDNIDDFLKEKLKTDSNNVITEEGKAALMRGFNLAKSEEENNKKNKHTIKNRMFVNVKTIPLPKLLLIILIAVAITLPMVTAGSQVAQIFNNSMRLAATGIDNTELYEYAFEHDLITYTDMEYVPLDDNYSIKIYTVLADGINYYFGFSLISDQPFEPNSRFMISDLQIADKNGNEIFHNENVTNGIKFSKNMHSSGNEVRELVSFIDSDFKLKSLDDLDINFSKINVYKYESNSPHNYSHLDINFAHTLELEEQIFQYEYYTTTEVESDGSFQIQNVMKTNIGLYAFVETVPNYSFDLNLKYENIIQECSYNIISTSNVFSNKEVKLYIFTIPNTTNQINIINDTNEYNINT